MDEQDAGGAREAGSGKRGGMSLMSRAIRRRRLVGCRVLELVDLYQRCSLGKLGLCYRGYKGDDSARFTGFTIRLLLSIIADSHSDPLG